MAVDKSLFKTSQQLHMRSVRCFTGLANRVAAVCNRCIYDSSASGLDLCNKHIRPLDRFTACIVNSTGTLG